MLLMHAPPNAPLTLNTFPYALSPKSVLMPPPAPRYFSTPQSSWSLCSWCLHCQMLLGYSGIGGFRWWSPWCCCCLILMPLPLVTSMLLTPPSPEDWEQESPGSPLDPDAPVLDPIMCYASTPDSWYFYHMLLMLSRRILVCYSHMGY